MRFYGLSTIPTAHIILISTKGKGFRRYIMKVLGIVAGRRNGNSEILLKEALLACQAAGAECKMINFRKTFRQHDSP